MEQSLVAPSQTLVGPGGEVKACLVCGQGYVDEDWTLICDGCEEEFHTYCLSPPLHQIPLGDWYCPLCCQKGRTTELIDYFAEHDKRKAKNKTHSAHNAWMKRRMTLWIKELEEGGYAAPLGSNGLIRDKAEFTENQDLIGRLLLLHIDVNTVHTGRIIDCRPYTKWNESEKLEYRLQFKSGADSRNVGFSCWCVLDEHACAVGVLRVNAASVSVHKCWTSTQLRSKPCFEFLQSRMGLAVQKEVDQQRYRLDLLPSTSVLSSSASSSSLANEAVAGELYNLSLIRFFTKQCNNVYACDKKNLGESWCFVDQQDLQPFSVPLNFYKADALIFAKAIAEKVELQNTIRAFLLSRGHLKGNGETLGTVSGLVDGFSLRSLKKLINIYQLNDDMHDRNSSKNKTNQKSKAKAKASNRVEFNKVEPIGFGVNTETRRLGQFISCEQNDQSATCTRSESREEKLNEGNDTVQLSTANLFHECGITDEHVLSKGVISVTALGPTSTFSMISGANSSIRHLFSSFLNVPADESSDIMTQGLSFAPTTQSLPKAGLASSELSTENVVDESRAKIKSEPSSIRHDVNSPSKTVQYDNKCSSSRQLNLVENKFQEVNKLEGMIAKNRDEVSPRVGDPPAKHNQSALRIIAERTKPSPRKRKRPSPDHTIESCQDACLTSLPRSQWIGKIVYYKPPSDTQRKKKKGQNARGEEEVGGIVGRVANYNRGIVQIVDPFDPNIQGRIGALDMECREYPPAQLFISNELQSLGFNGIPNASDKHECDVQPMGNNCREVEYSVEGENDRKVPACKILAAVPSVTSTPEVDVPPLHKPSDVEATSSGGGIRSQKAEINHDETSKCQQSPVVVSTIQNGKTGIKSNSSARASGIIRSRHINGASEQKSIQRKAYTSSKSQVETHTVANKMSTSSQLGVKVGKTEDSGRLISKCAKTHESYEQSPSPSLPGLQAVVLDAKSSTSAGNVDHKERESKSFKIKDHSSDLHESGKNIDILRKRGTDLSHQNGVIDLSRADEGISGVVVLDSDDESNQICSRRSINKRSRNTELETHRDFPTIMYPARRRENVANSASNKKARSLDTASPRRGCIGRAIDSMKNNARIDDNSKCILQAESRSTLNGDAIVSTRKRPTDEGRNGQASSSSGSSSGTMGLIPKKSLKKDIHSESRPSTRETHSHGISKADKIAKTVMKMLVSGLADTREQRGTSRAKNPKSSSPQRSNR